MTEQHNVHRSARCRANSISPMIVEGSWKFENYANTVLQESDAKSLWQHLLNDYDLSQQRNDEWSVLLQLRF